MYKNAIFKMELNSIRLQRYTHKIQSHKTSILTFDESDKGAP